MISSYRGHVYRWLGSRSENVVIAELRLSVLPSIVRALVTGDFRM